MSDFREQLRRARDGDSEAMNALIARFYPSVRSMVQRRRPRDPSTDRLAVAALFSTADVVQEVFVSVVRELDRIDVLDERSFAGYLAAIVRHRLVDMIRFHESQARNWRREQSVDGDRATPLEHPTRGPVGRAEDAELSQAFEAALANFSERDAQLLRARIESGEEFPSIAERLGYAHVDTARKAFYRAHARLLMRMQQDGFDAVGDRDEPS